ncbi:MAG: sigma-70 family RNA polymerase sigma factor [Pirellula sp.]
MQDQTRRLEELFGRLRGSDEAALAELFETWRGRLLQIVKTRLDQRLVGRLDPADVLQDAYLDLAKKLPRFAAEPSGMSPFVWIRLVVTERVLVTHRKHLQANVRDARREVSAWSGPSGTASVVLADRLIAQVSSVSSRVVRAEMSTAVLEVISSLEEIDREIIMMRAFEGLLNSEAAEVLGLSENGASSRFVRAMTKLRRELAAIPGLME